MEKRLVGVLLATAQLALVSLAAASCLAWLARRHWRLELLAHFRLQYLIGALVATLVFVAAHNRAWAVAALACVLLNGASIVPWYWSGALPSAQAGNTTRPLKLLQANVLYNNTRYADFLALVRAENPDLIFAQEVSQEWAETLHSLREAYPHSLLRGVGDAGGIAALSRWPLTKAAEVDLGSFLGPSLHLSCTVDGRELQFVTMHPPPPNNAQRAAWRNQQLQRAAAYTRALSGPKVLVGDFNVTLWSPYFAQLTAESGLRSARQGFGVLPSWPAFWPWPLRIPIDHYLVSEELRVVSLRTGADIGSDHLPLLLELLVPPAAETERGLP